MATIRPAERTDAKFIAWAIQTASRSHRPKGWFDIILERPERFCLEFVERLVLTKARSWWHYSRFHIAEVDGKPAAALSAFRAGEGYALTVPAMNELFASYAWDDAEQNAIWARSAYIFTCTFDGHDDAWTIENVATLPQHRKRGLAGTLISHVLPWGKRLGLAEAQISFLIGNDAAESAYARAGFVLDGERRSAEFLAATGSPGLRRYVKPL